MDSYLRLRERAREIFQKKSLIHCPYFRGAVVFNAEGLHHLRYSAERERSKPEQMLKFRLLPLALDAFRASGTVQEYRKIWQAVGKRGADGMRAAKEVEYCVQRIKARVRELLGPGNTAPWQDVRALEALGYAYRGGEWLTPAGATVRSRPMPCTAR